MLFGAPKTFGAPFAQNDTANILLIGKQDARAPSAKTNGSASGGAIPKVASNDVGLPRFGLLL
jgi:hypothetical protein